MEFLLSLLKELKLIGIHTALDTSGLIEISQAEELIKYIDLALLDIKQIDPIKHQWLTGFSNEKILAFAKYLSDNKIQMWIRHVVVPDITDNEHDVRALAKFIGTLETVSRIEVLPYHSMGKYKWNSLNLAYPLEGIRDAERSDVERVYRIFEEHGIIKGA
jgi:pyruvate formate lyase activating enzyme